MLAVVLPMKSIIVHVAVKVVVVENVINITANGWYMVSADLEAQNYQISKNLNRSRNEQ